MSKVSIMIPTFNQPQYIEQAVDSALMQDYEDVEIVVSDDSDNLDTFRIYEKKYAKNHKIKYFKNSSNLGRVGNYHKTLYERATGTYVLNLDGDDYLTDPHYLSKAVEILDQNRRLTCVFAKIKIFDEVKQTCLIFWILTKSFQRR